MVARIPDRAPLVPLKQREVDHPAEGQLVTISEAESISELQPHRAQYSSGHPGLVGNEQQQVAGLSLHSGNEPGQVLLAQELGER